MKKFLLDVLSFFGSFLLVLLALAPGVRAQSKYFLGSEGFYSTQEVSTLKGSGSDEDDDDDKDEDKDDDEDDDKDDEDKSESDDDEDDDDDEDEDKDDDEDDDKSSNSGKGSSKTVVKTGNSGSSLKFENKNKSDDDVEDEVERELEDEVEFEDMDDDMPEIEIEDDNEVKIKYDSGTRSGLSGKSVYRLRKETEAGRIDIRVREDGRVEVKVKTNDEDDAKELYEDVLESTEAAEILSVLPKDVITGSKVKIKYDEGVLKIQSKADEADTKFPLSVDPVTKTLFIETPSGKLNLAILPDEAITNLMKNKKVDTVTASEILENPDKKQDQDLLVYKVEGYKKVKLFGVIPVAAKVETVMGAQSGKVYSEEKPWYLDILGFMFTSQS